MFPVMPEETGAPPKAFATRAEAQSIADSISNKPRSGVAHPLFYGYLDAWIVEVRPRTKPYSNPGVLREDGTIAKYHP